jgi:heme/copper-type cytochrome/quinol oxidase subunit 2
MWPWPQHPIGWTLTGIIILILFFFAFWSNQMRFPFLDKYSGPWKQYLKSYTPFLFFSHTQGYNEIPRDIIEKLQWNVQGYIWKITMRYPGIHLKNHNEMPRDIIEKSQWNTLGYNWNFTMKCPGIQLKNCNEIPRDTSEISQWKTQGYNWKITQWNVQGYI